MVISTSIKAKIKWSGRKPKKAVWEVHKHPRMNNSYPFNFFV
jgi:hypothetical protein